MSASFLLTLMLVGSFLQVELANAGAGGSAPGGYGGWNSGGGGGGDFFSSIDPFDWLSGTSLLVPSNYPDYSPPSFVSDNEFNSLYSWSGGLSAGNYFLNTDDLLVPIHESDVMNNLWSSNQSSVSTFNLNLARFSSDIDFTSYDNRCTYAPHESAGLDRVPLLAGILSNSISNSYIDERAYRKGVNLADLTADTLRNAINIGISSPETAAANIAEGRFDIDRTWYQGYYKGVFDSYKAANVDPFTQTLPVGAMKAWSDVSGDIYTTYAQKVDLAFMNGGANIDIILPLDRPISFYRDMGFSNLELAGVMSKPLVVAEKTVVSDLYSDHPIVDRNGDLTTVGQMFLQPNVQVGGFAGDIFLAISTNSDGSHFYASAVAHEGNHGGVMHMAGMTPQALQNAGLVGSKLEAGIEAIRAANLMYTKRDYSIGSEAGLSDAQLFDDEEITDSLSDIEVFAFLQSTRENPEIFLSIITRVVGSEQAAVEVIEKMKTTEWYNYYDAAISGFYDQLSDNEIHSLLNSQYREALR